MATQGRNRTRHGQLDEEEEELTEQNSSCCQESSSNLILFAFLIVVEWQDDRYAIVVYSHEGRDSPPSLSTRGLDWVVSKCPACLISHDNNDIEDLFRFLQPARNSE